MTFFVLVGSFDSTDLLFWNQDLILELLLRSSLLLNRLRALIRCKFDETEARHSYGVALFLLLTVLFSKLLPLTLPRKACSYLSIGDDFSGVRNFFKNLSYSSFFSSSISAPFSHCRSVFDGLKIFYFITDDVCHAAIRCSSLSNLAVFGHIPSICLKLRFRSMIRLLLIWPFSLSSVFIYLRKSMSLFFSRAFSTIFFFSLRFVLLRSSFLTLSNSFSSSPVNYASSLRAVAIFSSIASVRRPDKAGLMCAVPRPVMPWPALTHSFLFTFCGM